MPSTFVKPFSLHPPPKERKNSEMLLHDVSSSSVGNWYISVFFCWGEGRLDCYIGLMLMHLWMHQYHMIRGTWNGYENVIRHLGWSIWAKMLHCIGVYS